MSLPTLRTPRLILRPWRLEDTDALHRLWTDPDVRRYLWDDQIITRARAEETVREALHTAALEGFGEWIVEAPAGTLAGFCGLMRRDAAEDPELLYGLAPRCWGRGLATEAARAVLAYAFDELGLARVTAATDPPNAASARVLTRLGMRPTHHGTLNGLETAFYELTRGDFVRARPRTVRR